MLKNLVTSNQDVPVEWTISNYIEKVKFIKLYNRVMGIVDLLYPRVCVGCGKEGEYVCEQCEGELIMPPTICPVCGRYAREGWTHPECKQMLDLDRLVVGLPYKGLVQIVLKKVKYRSAWDALDSLLEMWNRKAGSLIDSSETLITSVPMYKQKERERGFNQAKVIAVQLARTKKLKYLDLLERVRETKPMYGLSKKERSENMANAFRVIKELSEKVILVDDVWTTGATIKECAQTLKLAGAREVWGVTLAR